MKKASRRQNSVKIAHKETVGFVGWPAEDALEQFKGAELLDLDNSYPDVQLVSGEDLPNNVCHIIKRIVSNALALPLRAVVIDDGPGKCDMAGMAGRMLADRLDIPVIFAPNAGKKGSGTRISDSTLPTVEKARRILDGLTIPVKTDDLVYESKPPAAVWGVPAADLRLYDLFPDGARLLGWFRCLENRTPDNEELEREILPGVPTVFFAQTFCHKNILAKHLAKVHVGLYVDADGVITGSVKAKIEAFLRFNR